MSGENRVVDDEVDLLRERGHVVDAWQPSVSRDSGSLHQAADAVWSRSASQEVVDRIRKLSPEVVHVHNLFPRLSPAVLRVLPPGVALVATLHNFRLMCLPSTYLRNGSICEVCARRVPWRGVLHACYRDSRAASAVLAASLVAHRALDTFSRVDSFLAVSRFVRAKHVEAGFDAGRIRVKSNFVPSVDRRQGPGEYLLFLGRIAREKGLDTVIHALPDAVGLVVAGDGPERTQLERSVGSNVSFTGPVSPDEVLALLRGARALVVPSRWYEGQPRVILEAFATGVPVLASSIGGLPELVRAGFNGDLVNPDDVDGWRAAIARAADPELSIRLGAQAYETWLARFTPDVAIGELEAAYAAAVSSRTGAR